MDENKDILQMLRERENEFRLPLRPDGWEKLEAGLNISPAQEYGLSGSVRRSLRKWGSIAALFLLCLSLSISFLMRKDVKKMVADNRLPETSVPVNRSVVPDGSKTDSMVSAELVAIRYPRPHVVNIPETLPAFELTDTVIASLNPIEMGPASSSRLNSTSQNTRKNTRKNNGPEVDKGYNLKILPPQSEKGKKVSRWSVGVQMGSNNLASPKGSWESFDANVTEPGKPVNPDKEPDSEDKCAMNTRAAIGGGTGFDGNSISYFYHHRLPITVSLSVRRYLSASFALETGISYSYLYSEITEKNSSRVGNQKLHYIGIPLKASWTFFRKKDISFYISGGGMLEYGISLRKNNSSLPVNRWQPSLNAAAGMQVEVVRPLSLFVEPGIGYYPNMNRNATNSYFTRFESIRTVHPCTFSLQIGLRFSY